MNTIVYLNYEKQISKNVDYCIFEDNGTCKNVYAKISLLDYMSCHFLEQLLIQIMVGKKNIDIANYYLTI